MSSIKSILPRTYPIIVILLIWEACHYLNIGSSIFFPPPSVFLKDVISNDYRVGLGSQSASIMTSIYSSVYRVSAGLTIAFLLAILIGFMISWSTKFKPFIMSTLSLFAPIAPIAWIPLAIIAFGIGNTAAIFIVFMGVFFTLTIATVDALDQVPPIYINRALSKGAKWHQILLLVRLPYILPRVFTILRLNFIAAWMAVLAAEMTGLNDGLGNIFMTGRNLFNNNLIMLGMSLIAITGFTVDILLSLIQDYLFRWKTKK